MGASHQSVIQNITAFCYIYFRDAFSNRVRQFFICIFDFMIIKPCLGPTRGAHHILICRTIQLSRPYFATIHIYSMELRSGEFHGQFKHVILFLQKLLFRLLKNFTTIYNASSTGEAYGATTRSYMWRPFIKQSTVHGLLYRP